MMAAYTSGEWHVKPGREQEFVDGWKEVADWVTKEFDPTGWAKLLRDKENPGRFVSVGEWLDEATVDKWRASERAEQQLGMLRKLVDEGGVRDFQLVAEVGPTSTR
jgi:quinol monooxygenase YgiN